MDYKKAIEFLRSLPEDELLGCLIYGEASGETTEGKIAVACTAINRRNRKSWYGKTLKDVILKPYQYSCFNANDPNLLRILKARKQSGATFCDCWKVAIDCIKNHPWREDPTHGATHYHTIARPRWAKVWPPSWASKMVNCGTIDSHVFYLEK